MWKFSALYPFLCMLLAACQPQITAEERNFRETRALRQSEFSPCERNSSILSTVAAESRCLLFSVAENPEQPDGRRISLRVMLVSSVSAEPVSDPLVLLAGGPGQAASRDLLPLVQVFRRIRQDRDILLVDQRGTGELSPISCEEDSEQLNLSLEEILAVQTETLAACLAEMEASPEFYTTDIAIQDLEQIREYLGYSQFNLWGGSYGTRVALAYLKAYPQTTRSVIIDGVAPVDLSLPLYMERDASRALQLIFDDCEAEIDCATAFPDLESHYRELLARLEIPRDFIVFDALDQSGQSVTLEVYNFLGALRYLLYGRQTQRLVPYLIEQAYEGNYQPLLAALPPETGLNVGMFLSVVCNEDFSLISDDALQAEGNNQYLMGSEYFTLPILDACVLWPKRQLPASYFEPVRADNPVLILSGELDPVTPPVWGRQVAANLPNARHLVIQGYAHGTYGSGCTLSIMREFIESAQLEDLDTDCIDTMQRRPFFTSIGGSGSPDD